MEIKYRDRNFKYVIQIIFTIKLKNLYIILTLIANDDNLCIKGLILKKIQVLVSIVFDICTSMTILGRWPWRQIAESTTDPAAIADSIMLSNQMSAKRKVRVRPSIRPSRD